MHTPFIFLSTKRGSLAWLSFIHNCLIVNKGVPLWLKSYPQSIGNLLL